MTTPPPERRTGRPRKSVRDEARAAQVLDELSKAEHQIRETTERRHQLVLEASSLGLTVARIGEALGTSPATVSKWVRTSRKNQQDSSF